MRARTTELSGQPTSGRTFASGANRRYPGSRGPLAASLIVHAAVVGGSVWLTVPAGEPAPRPEWESIALIQLEPDAPPPEPLPEPAIEPPAQPPEAREPVRPAPAPEPRVPGTRDESTSGRQEGAEPGGFQLLAAPDAVPDEIAPTIPGPETLEEDFGGRGLEGGRGGGAAPLRGSEGGGEASEAAGLETGPRYTPVSVLPELRNERAVQRALLRNYPPVLRDAGIGGMVVVWLLIDEEGRVVSSQLHTSSGRAPLDQAALAVVQIMEFTPALHNDRKIRVWIDLPVIFSAR